MSKPQPIRRDMLAIVQDEMIMRDRIAATLANGEQTIPELADALGYPTHEMTVWVFAMRRYGLLEEIGRADIDGYFKYEVKEEAPATAEQE